MKTLEEISYLHIIEQLQEEVKKEAQFVGNGVININTDNYGNRR